MCDERTLAELRADDRVVVRYVDNPNGSLDDIAGICNEGRNVVGLMPHPERASDALLGSADGVVLLRSLLAAAGARAIHCGRVTRVRLRRLRRSHANGSRLVADTFAAPTPGAARAICRRCAAATSLDMGCGPGYTTALLRDALPALGASPGSTRRRRWSPRRARACPARTFAVADVTAPLRLPADLVYSRLLLGHLPDPDGALAHWAPRCVRRRPARVRGAGCATAATTRVFARYEAAVDRGRRRARRHAVGRPGARPRSAGVRARCSTGSSSIRCRPRRAAAMFWRNARRGVTDVDGAARHRSTSCERSNATDPDDVVMWELRQTVWSRRSRASVAA